MLCCCKIEYDADLLERALLLCPKWRREKAKTIKNPKTLAEYITAGALLRFCLKENADNVFILPSGKPMLNEKGYFSLSHSGEYAACAVSDRPTGVDIQRVEPISEKVISRFCTEREQFWLAERPDKNISAIRLWALKESYLKASEKSIAEVFESEFSISDSGKVNGPCGYLFYLSEAIDGYIVALCEKSQDCAAG